MPMELQKMIISHLDNGSTKNVALTSKKMKMLAYEKLWSKPRFDELKDIDFLYNISHLPIQELHIVDFDCSWVEIVGILPHLRALHIDDYDHFEPNNTQLRYLKVPVIVHLSAFDLRGEHFEHITGILENLVVKDIVLCDFPMNFNRRLTYEQFELLADKFPISWVSINCLDITENNVVDFIKVLGKLSCKVELVGHYPDYSFTLENLKLMMEHGIRIIKIYSFFLRTEGESAALLEFAKLMRKMKYLEEFQFCCEDFEEGNAAPLELMTDLPFRYLKSWNFQLDKKGDATAVAKILSRMKSLRWHHNFYSYRGFHLKRNFVTLYQLSVEEFALFKDLPVTSVDIEALALTKDNVKDFREIMNGMKILDLCFLDCDFDDEDFEVVEEDFGPNGIYKTIIAIR